MSDIPIPERPTPSSSSREDRWLFRMQGVLTLVIALAAIGLALWEGIENRRHNRLTVQPRLGAAINTGRDTAGEFVKMEIESTGLGPAVIKTFRIYFDGVMQDSVVASGIAPWQKAIDTFSTSGSYVSAHALGSGYYLPSGRQHLLFEARRSGAARGAALGDIMKRLALQICYCSVYNTDCEEVVLSMVPLEAESCGIPRKNGAR